MKSNKILSKLQTRKFKVGSIATSITLIVTAVIIIINLIAAQLTTKFNLSLDMTPNKVFSLTEQSRDFIKNLDKDVEIILLNDEGAFSGINEYFSQANSVLKQYDLNSDKIKLTYVDTTKNPTYLNSYQNEDLSENSIIVKCGNKHKVITVNDIFDIQRSYYGSNITGSKAEQELTSAILYVTSDDQMKVSVLNGYGTQDASGFTELLKKNNFDVSEISLLTEDIPDNVKLAIIYAPERDFDKSGIEKIEKFLSAGDKSLIYALNPKQEQSPNLNALFEKYNIKIKDGLVYETNMQNVVSSIFIPINEYVDADYKSDLKNADIPVLMPFARPIEVLNTENTRTLLQFSSTAGICPQDADQNFDFQSNVSGPIPSVVLSLHNTDDEKTSNVAVISSFVSLNQEYLSSNALNNSAYFVNMVNTMSNREDVGITIESKSLGGEELGLNQATANTIGIVITIILPLAVLIIGAVVFFKRKNK